MFKTLPICYMIGAAFVTFGTSKVDAEEQAMLPYLEYLDTMGKKLDCYFTIEDVRTSNALTVLSQATLRDDPRITPDAFIKKLLTELPNVDVWQDKQNRAVIHIASKLLANEKDYSLTKVGSIDFEGALGDLPLHIGNILKIPLGTPVYGTIQELSYDRSTEVRFTANDRQVRSILTDVVPLAGYSRVLWTAETLTYSGKRETWVRFSGPVSWDRMKRADKSPVPFDAGQVAYASNAADEMTVKSALGYLHSELKKKSPRQVRWTMFWLGAHQVKKAIPELLAAIDYKFTESSFFAEDHPALRALMLYGDEGAGAAAGALKHESDPKRILLLLQLIVQIKGHKAATSFLQKSLTAPPDAITDIEIERFIVEMQKLDLDLEKTDLLKLGK